MNRPKSISSARPDALDVDKIRGDFPVLQRKVNGQSLVYFDNAATSQKPESVIRSIDHYYRTINSNVHRGAHELASRSTEAYEEIRNKASRFINARSVREINFTRGTTEGINLVAYAWGQQQIEAGDEILLTAMEHHSNIVPWQMLCERKNAELKVVPVTPEGELDLEAFDRLLGERTKLVTLVHTSNSLGTVNPVERLIKKAHKAGAKVMIDGAQAVPHRPVDVRELDCDFFVCSGHKMFGPTGIGIMYGKESLLEEMPPFHGGGEMIEEVTFERTTYNDLPYKFEAGTPNIADAIGLGAAMDYIQTIGYDAIMAHEDRLLEYATERVMQIDGLHLVGTAEHKASVLSFIVDGVHNHDLSVLLDKQGIALRDGHHCCQPLMRAFGIEGTCRASLAFYNTKTEIDRLVEGIQKAKGMLAS